MKRPLTVILAFILIGSSASASEWQPWEVPATTPVRSTSSSAPLQLAVKLFQKYISPIDGPRCPMYPTCSTYSLQALRKHGPLLGVFQTVDRLYREGDPHEHQQPVDKWGYVRFADPLKNNDFWLNSSQ